MIEVVCGRPERSPELEEKVTERLRAIDSLLGVRWMPHAAYSPRTRTFEGRYALTVRWPESDPRWLLYRKGEIGEPFDILGWFSEDLHDAHSEAVDVDALESKVLALLGRSDNTREPWKERMKRSIEHNRRRRQEIKAGALEAGVENVDRELSKPDLPTYKVISHGR